MIWFEVDPFGVFIDGFPTATTLQATMTAEISTMRLDIGAFGKLGHKII